MKRWLVIIAAVIAIGSAATVTYNAQARPNAAAQDCDDWGNDTADRVEIARLLLYPPERDGESTGSLSGDAQALYDVAQEQANSDPPDEGVKLNGDLVEAMSAASAALGGGGGASPDVQIAFAKAIIYNADLRLAYLLDGC